MAPRRRRFYNPHQRDAATFLETSEESGGERTLIALEVAPGGKVTPHHHLTYAERFRVREGRLTVSVGDARYELSAGDEAVAPPGSLHEWSNQDSDLVVADVELRPGHPGFEKALRVAYGLAADGLVLANGMPRNPLHAALLLEWGEAGLPGAYGVLERGLGVLARVARALGVDRRLERRYLL
jgi:mannose-6-phosphate isomerase-like protein (cupin superfamily)